MDMKLFKQHLLDELYEPYHNCTACPLGFLGRQHIVFGEGNPQASLMLIGEGPGREEDILNRPFVGRSGKLLDKVLELASFARKDVYIANVVKCRPPENRKPLPIESKTCKNLLLLQQIKIIRPLLICTLGSSALEALLEKPVSISKMRGKPLEYNNTVIIPTYHPAYILRNRNELEAFVHDIQLAQKIISSSLSKVTILGGG
jgi:uracil-DNA glycosylase